MTLLLRPPITGVDFQGIPPELIERRQWVAWEWITRGGKRTKPPLDPATGYRASSTNPRTWSTFDEAVAFCAKDNRAAGIGFVFTADDPFGGVDLDKCRDLEDGKLAPWAHSFVRFLDSYTEVSPSGTGVKAFVRGAVDSGLKRGPLEIYSSGRYFTVTGKRLPISPLTLSERREELNLLWRWLSQTPSAKRVPPGTPVVDDGELIARAKAAKNGIEFDRLWRGDWSHYQSQSEADLALCGYLAFWCSGEMLRIDRLFRQSGLFRPKWDEPHYGDGRTYGEATVARAGAGGPGWTPNGSCPPGPSLPRWDSSGGDDRLLETDLGNAGRLAKQHGDDIRYCFPTRRFHIWDGKHWPEDSTGHVYRLAKQTARSLFDEAKAASNPDRSKQLAQHAVKTQAEQRLDAMVRLVRSEPGIPVEPQDFDRDPWLFNVLNGTVDLKSGELRPHRRDDFLTKMSRIRLTTGAQCPTWLAFLIRILADDEPLVRFVQKAIGYSLTGDVSEQVIFFLHGAGANGKSTLLSLVLELLGDYGKQAAPGLLTVKRGESHPTELADLAGARFVAAVEVDEGRRLAEALTKWISGGDKLKARFMRKDFFEFSPTHKLWLATNHKPTVVGADNAIWRRIQLIPFDVSIPEVEQDKFLGNTLRQELPGILRWAIDGCLAWQKEGLSPPKKVLVATTGYREEQDVLGGFMADCCIREEGAKASAGELYAAFKRWSDENGEQPVSQKVFGSRLADSGFTRHRGTAGRWAWSGIGLVTHPTLKSDTSDPS